MRHFEGIDRWEPEPHIKFFRVAAPLIVGCLPSQSVVVSPLRLSGGVASRARLPVRSRQVCGANLLRLLDFKHNGEVFVCRHSTSCTNAHRSLNEVSKTEALSSLSFLSGALKQHAELGTSDVDCVSASPITTSSMVGELDYGGAGTGVGLGKRKRPPENFFLESRLAMPGSSGVPMLEEVEECVVFMNPFDQRGRRNILVRQSLHEEAGLGAFLRVDGIGGQWIGTYLGVKHCDGPLSDYQLAVGRTEIDACLEGVVQCRAAYINDPLDEQAENVEFVERLVTLRAGPEYWLDRAGSVSAKVFHKACTRYLFPNNAGSRMLWDDALKVNQLAVIELRANIDLAPYGFNIALITGNQDVSDTSALHVEPVERNPVLSGEGPGGDALCSDVELYPSTPPVTLTLTMRLLHLLFCDYRSDSMLEPQKGNLNEEKRASLQSLLEIAILILCASTSLSHYLLLRRFLSQKSVATTTSYYKARPAISLNKKHLNQQNFHLIIQTSTNFH
eukprot:gene118-175_t